MNTTPTLLTILAQIDRFQAMRGSLKPGGRTDYTQQLLLLLAVIVIVASVAVIVRMLNKRSQRVVDHPRGLFRELCRVHGLSRGQEAVLRELAAGLALEHPSRLFLETNLFEQVLSEPRFAAWQAGEKRRSLITLRDQLFGAELDLQQAVGSV